MAGNLRSTSQSYSSKSSPISGRELLICQAVNWVEKVIIKEPLFLEMKMWLGPRTGEILLPANDRASGDSNMSRQLSVLKRGTSPNSRTMIGMLEVPSSLA